jgi:hypothetical protein
VIAARVYDQSALEDDRQAMERALTFASPEPPAPRDRDEPVVRLAAPGKKRRPRRFQIPDGS